jgi:hypothetical protein
VVVLACVLVLVLVLVLACVAGRGWPDWAGCPLKPAGSWDLSPRGSLALGPDPDGSRIVAMSTTVRISIHPAGTRGQR